MIQRQEPPPRRLRSLGGGMTQFYYPGAEEECDLCDCQAIYVEDGETKLVCEVFPYKSTVLHWNCMKEKV